MSDPQSYFSYGYQTADYIMAKLDHIIHKIQQLEEKLDALMDALLIMHSTAKKRKPSPVHAPEVSATMARCEALVRKMESHIQTYQDLKTQVEMVLHQQPAKR
ncbi:hypothetical protein GCK32_007501 [Trichostrongylus colubriformis]|uniref:Uncharacterized protein n=1 Tax=Trichostrongylus colubriformis TaxID=6319 RepID=A0AAN8EW84_TRICO